MPPARSLPEPAPDAFFVEGYLSYLMARAQHLISAEFNARLAAAGVPLPVWRLLATVYGSDGLRVGELARAMLYKQPTVSKLIDRLEADGLVERRAVGKDRRTVLVVLTPSGRSLVAGLIAEARIHQDEVLGAFTKAETESMFRMLRQLIARLGGETEIGAATSC